MKKIIIILILIILIGAGGFFILKSPAAYHDGIYTASTSGAFGDTKITLEIKDGKILKCNLEAVDKEGNIKNENYGRNSGEKNFQIAQTALAGTKKYPELLIEAQDVEKVDAISGATVSHREFVRLVQEALKKSREAVGN